MSVVSLPEFLSEDFSRVGEPVLNRCDAIDGKKIYLSGGTGFFGQNILALLSYLYSRGARFEVTALSRAPEFFLSRQDWCRRLPWLTLLQGDAREVWPGRDSYDLLLHAATDTGASAHRDKRLVFHDMMAITQQAIDFCDRKRVRRVLLTGSGAQYGVIPPTMLAGIREDAALACDPTSPSSAYGEAKRVGELLSSLYAERSGASVVNVRCFAFVGPGLPLDGHFAIGNFIGDALAKRAIHLRSAGLATRSYLYSADLAIWLLLLLLEAPGGSVVNVGSDQGLQVRQLAEIVGKVLRSTEGIRFGEGVADEERQVYVPAIDRALDMGLAIWTTLDLAIKRTAAWYATA